MDEILEKIKDSENWPSIPNDENLELLNEMADNSFLQNTFEGKFSALLIYHQIIEAMCLHLIYDCDFFIKLALHPMTISSQISDKKMLGFYVDMLEKSIDFNNKDDFLESVRAFNLIRNRIVHELTKKNLDEINEMLNDIKTKFDEIYDIYDETQDWFRLCFKDFRKDVFIDYFDDDNQ